jgi:putative transposase
VRSSKESGLERIIFFGEESLRTALQNLIAHYHAERNHQGLANQLISPEAGHLDHTGEVQRRQRLGGLLNYTLAPAA